MGSNALFSPLERPTSISNSLDGILLLHYFNKSAVTSYVTQYLSNGSSSVSDEYVLISVPNVCWFGRCAWTGCCTMVRRM